MTIFAIVLSMIFVFFIIDSICRFMIGSGMVEFIVDFLNAIFLIDFDEEYTEK